MKLKNVSLLFIFLSAAVFANAEGSVDTQPKVCLSALRVSNIGLVPHVATYDLAEKIIAGAVCDFSSNFQFASKPKLQSALNMFKNVRADAMKQTEVKLARAGFVEIPEFRRELKGKRKLPEKVFIRKDIAAMYLTICYLGAAIKPLVCIGENPQLSTNISLDLAVDIDKQLTSNGFIRLTPYLYAR